MRLKGKKTQSSQDQQRGLFECIPFKHISITDLKEAYILSGECFDRRVDGRFCGRLKHMSSEHYLEDGISFTARA